MIAYLILAYKNPVQVARLVSRLQSKNTMVFIHVDAKVNILPFLTLCNQPYVTFVKKRHKIVWGGYSITEALISGMAEITKNKNCENIVLLSGQDYPIRHISEFEDFIRVNEGYSFLNVEEATVTSKWWQNAVRRYKYYYVSDYNIKGKRFLNRILRRILPERKFIYPEYKLYGGPGSTFGILTFEAAAYIVAFMEGNLKAKRFAKTTFASDEFWFQTILMNSPLKEKVNICSLWYMKWNGTSKHPNILKFSDLYQITHSNSFFARKFDMYVDNSVLDMIDQKILLTGHYQRFSLSRSLKTSLPTR
jgi:hypothetical protein